MNSSEKLRPPSPANLAKCNAAAAFCDTHVHGAGFLRNSKEHARRKRPIALLRNEATEMSDIPADRLPVTPDDVKAAADAIAGAVMATECDRSRTLSEICGCQLWLKFENLQFTSSFK